MRVGRRNFLTAGLGALVASPALADTPQDSGSHLPAIVADDLERRTLRFPGDLAARRTILLIAFKRGQQDEVDGWVRGLGLGETGPAWYEMPVIDDPGLFGRWFISEGMRGGVPDPVARRHVAVVYTDAAAFRRAMGITTVDRVTIAVVDRAGQVVATQQGPFAPAVGASIRQAAI